MDRFSMVKIPVFHLRLCLSVVVLFPARDTRDSGDMDYVKHTRDCGTTDYNVADLNEFGITNIEDIPDEEFFGTEPRRELNKFYSKHHDEVTDRFTLDYAVHTIALCRCWKSKDFPYCDKSHKIHNKFHKDNVGPIILDGPTLPDHVLDRFTQPTPNRSITFSTPSTLSDSAIESELEKRRKEHEYPDSDENVTYHRIDKNDFFERMRKFPPGLRPKTAPWGFV